MRVRILLATGAVAVIGLAGSPALAAGNEQNGPTVGDCISDGFYGNEPNIEGPFAPGGPQEQEPGTKGGRVVPSNSPGPQLNNGTRGLSVGEANQLAKAAGFQNLADVCRQDPTAFE